MPLAGRADDVAVCRVTVSYWTLTGGILLPTLASLLSWHPPTAAQPAAAVHQQQQQQAAPPLSAWGRAAQKTGAAFAACDRRLHAAFSRCSCMHVAAACYYLSTLAWWSSCLAAGL